MPDVSVVLSAAVVCLLGVMSPGPAFIAVSHRAATATRAEVLAMATGIAAVNVLWAGLALFGFGAVLVAHTSALVVLKLCGAAYLIWIGVQMLRRCGRLDGLSDTSRAGAGVRRALRDGVRTNLANPKAMMFYVAVFAGSVPAGATAATMGMLLGVVGLVALSWYGSLALTLSVPAVAARLSRARAGIDRGCGGLLIVLGAWQAVSAGA